jgi:hypothetical protein
MLFFHIISIYVYGLMPARNKGMYVFPVPARFLFAYWMFPLHMLVFHIISIYVYGLTPARNKGMHAFPVPARYLSRSHVREDMALLSEQSS